MVDRSVEILYITHGPVAIPGYTPLHASSNLKHTQSSQVISSTKTTPNFKHTCTSPPFSKSSSCIIWGFSSCPNPNIPPFQRGNATLQLPHELFDGQLGRPSLWSPDAPASAVHEELEEAKRRGSPGPRGGWRKNTIWRKFSMSFVFFKRKSEVGNPLFIVLTSTEWSPIWSEMNERSVLQVLYKHHFSGKHPKPNHLFCGRLPFV